MKTGIVCKKAGISNTSFSKYRDRLVARGILTSTRYGYVSQALPRFYEVVRNYIR